MWRAIVVSSSGSLNSGSSWPAGVRRATAWAAATRCSISSAAAPCPQRAPSNPGKTSAPNSNGSYGIVSVRSDATDRGAAEFGP